jgi:hypothetical protein
VTAKSNNSIATINKITLFLFKINPAIPHRNKRIVNVMIILYYICIISSFRTFNNVWLVT